MAASWLARLAGRPVAVKPGSEQVIRQGVAADEGGAHMPAEHRRAVVTAARIAASQVPAVLPEPAPQRGLAGLCQRVGADAYHPAIAVSAVLAVLVEEVQALRRAAGTADALSQVPRPRDTATASASWPVSGSGPGPGHELPDGRGRQPWTIQQTGPVRRQAPGTPRHGRPAAVHFTGTWVDLAARSVRTLSRCHAE
jgi:hypothetical protein